MWVQSHCFWARQAALVNITKVPLTERWMSVFVILGIIPTGCHSSRNKLKVQLDSKKCTGRYFNIRDDDLSSKQV